MRTRKNIKNIKNIKNKSITKMNRIKNVKKSKKKIFSKKDFSAGDGFLTTVWGPALWHSLHTMSFNYPG